MNRNKTFYALLLLLLVSTLMANAQRRGVRQKAKPIGKAIKATKPADNSTTILYNNLLSSTAKVMFIDSIVVDREKLFASIPLNKQLGMIEYVDSQYAYVNQLGNQRLVSKGDSVGGYFIYSSEKVGNNWTPLRKMDDFTEGLRDCSYPLLLSDGITLFFAAKGENSLGGYDIFTTSFDTDKGRYYKAENYGMPFNSMANDYFIAIDEVDTLGWLATDRFQPAGKVCIYTFVPKATRENMEVDSFTEKEIKDYADLRSIAKTWGFGDREAALNRLQKLQERTGNVAADISGKFVVNEKITCYSAKDFKSTYAKSSYTQWLELKKDNSNIAQQLADLRQKFHSSSPEQKSQLKESMLRLEQQYAQLQKDIHIIEKKIRNSEMGFAKH